VQQYHTIYGLPGWCKDEYLKWDGSAGTPAAERE